MRAGKIPGDGIAASLPRSQTRQLVMAVRGAGNENHLNPPGLPAAFLSICCFIELIQDHDFI